MLRFIGSMADFSLRAMLHRVIACFGLRFMMATTLSSALTLAISQEHDSVSGPMKIIDKIHQLESNRDPKCYATANRLENFMYGTPLDDDARNLRIEIQKEIGLFIRSMATKIARSNNRSEIIKADVIRVTDSLAVVGRLKNGDYFWQADSLLLRIKRVDFDQYASVAFSYRSLLSVELDLIFVEEVDLLPLSNQALESLNAFLNLGTLASLNVADAMAREENASTISEYMMRRSWIRILSRPANQALFAFQYPSASTTASGNDVLKSIIAQKLSSYSNYNNISTSVFLRNIQVYFAKQRWPIDKDKSRQLRNYFLESLITFAQSLVHSSYEHALGEQRLIIRVRDVQKAGALFLPFEANEFEDIIYFPNDIENSITIESYDLDAFRDGGIHWRVLDYALEDSATFMKTTDAPAAELITEYVAQLGVLVLRFAGQNSLQMKKERLDIIDLESGFKRVQQLINTYSTWPQRSRDETPVVSSVEDAASGIVGKFIDVSIEKNISFEHRSSDWLSRFIRSYVYSAADTTAKLAIPPAFGGSGVGVEDLNNDGLMDILLLGGLQNKLLLNQASGKFVDVSEKINLNVWNEEKQSFEESRQPIIADFDNDGQQDIVITYVDAMHRVLKNEGDLKFLDLTNQANLDGRGLVAGPATALDYDGDGLLDLFIGYFGNYLAGDLPTLSRNNQNGSRNRLYRNLGDFKFVEVPFTKDSDTDNGWTQAVGHTDINQDGRQDLIVGNDFGINRYYFNTDTAGFIEVAQLLKTDKPSYTMNVGIGDLNADQHPDLYISNIVVMQKEEKYVSPNAETTMKFDPEKMNRLRTVEANDLFVSQTEAGQFTSYAPSSAVGRGLSATGWSWDADFFDFDNDGDEDLYCLNGMNDFQVYATENPFYYAASDQGPQVEYAQSNRERNVFFVNRDGMLVNEAAELGVDLLTNSRSASYADFDLDGDLDIIMNNYHDKAFFLENRSADPTNNWLIIKLMGDPAQGVNLDAIGSSISLLGQGKASQWREVHSTTGYLSVHPKEQHFGLGKIDAPMSIEVKWSNGQKSRIDGLHKNRKYIIRYPNILLN